MKAVSDKRRAENVVRAEVMEETFGPREEWFCHFEEFQEAHPDVFVRVKHLAHQGPVDGHEIVKRSRGGSITDPSNITLLCQFHNGWVEDYPLTAMKLGLADHSKPVSKTTKRIEALNRKNHPHD